MGALTWGRIVVAVLAILVVGVLGAWRAYRIGREGGLVDGFRRGEASERAIAKVVVATRLATIHENRRQGQLNRHAKAKRGDAP